jgi:hypothetical protein
VRELRRRRVEQGFAVVVAQSAGDRLIDPVAAPLPSDDAGIRRESQKCSV